MAVCENCGEPVGSLSVPVHKMFAKVSRDWCPKCIRDDAVSDLSCPFCGEKMLHGMIVVKSTGDGRGYLLFSEGREGAKSRTWKTVFEQKKLFNSQGTYAFHCESCGALAAQLGEE